jgi:hypothetical protein
MKGILLPKVNLEREKARPNFSILHLPDSIAGLLISRTVDGQSGSIVKREIKVKLPLTKKLSDIFRLKAGWNLLFQKNN